MPQYTYMDETPQEPIIQQVSEREWLDNLLDESIRKRASDIHIEPGQGSSFMRLRIDGMMYVLNKFESGLHASMVSQIKVLANLDIAVNFSPQDGQFEYRYKERMHYVRVSTFPTIHGEALVMRLLNRKDSLHDLEHLGFDSRQLTDIMHMIHNPFGMVLATGPSGSGKSTLLNSIIAHLNTDQNNIITVENPVEYHMEGVRQAQINLHQHFSFAEALRAILRQDPDIMMIGEIRDAETAQIAVQATLTGRLFLSTFHTLDVFAIVTRFIEMEIPRSVVAHVISGVISARLIRRVCSNCISGYKLTEQEELAIGSVMPPETTYVTGAGCEQCLGTGFKGTTGIFEVVAFNDDLMNAIIQNASLAEMRSILMNSNIKTLRGSALDKVVQGVTSPTEAIRVTGD